jgi:hypothetical protein
MHEYEIRVLSAGHTILIATDVQPSDSAAIRWGKKIAADKQFEVWSGSECIYGGSSTLGAPLSP